jgi:hypothetical protein
MPANIFIAGMARSYSRLKTKAAGIFCGFCISATIATLIA